MPIAAAALLIEVPASAKTFMAWCKTITLGAQLAAVTTAIGAILNAGGALRDFLHAAPGTEEGVELLIQVVDD
ncbi:hypothetical protein ACVWVZ_001048 [Pseudomonas tolaasii]